MTLGAHGGLRPVTDPDVIEGYLTDASNIRGSAEGLLYPKSTEEVAAIVAHCQANCLPLTVVAGRTSTTAAAVPQGGWILSTEHLVGLRDVDAGQVTAGGGHLLGALQDTIESSGFFYPPDPTSRHECTLGASIACNASGARSFRYGATRRWVTALTVVLPTGEVLHVDADTPIPASWPDVRWAEPSVKTAAGYSGAPRLLDLFIGQEGTLGVITEATLRLIPLPERVFGVLAYFPSRQTAVAFVEAARDALRADARGPLSPRCLEYLDARCLQLARERVGGVPDGAKAALFCEQEGYVDEDAHLEGWLDALAAAGALVDDTLVTTDPAGQKALHALRHAVPAGVNERVIANGMPKVGTDLSVPDAALSEMMDHYERAPLENVLFGHIGDNHLHLNLLPRTPDELVEARAFYDDLARHAIALGGSVSAEHGIGKLKKKHLAWMVGEPVVEGFRALKAHLDPNWVLGRGNLLDRV